jgi:WD40 repeat protein
MARRGKRLGLSLGAAACLAALVGSGIWTRPERRAAYAVAFSPRGDRLAAVTEVRSEGTGRLWIWDVATGRQIAATTMPDRPLAVAYAPTGTAVATGAWSGAVQLWDSETGRLLRSFSGHSLPVRGLAFLPDGKTLAGGASDGRVVLWDVASGRERLELDRGRHLPINGMAISHDGRFLAAAASPSSSPRIGLSWPPRARPGPWASSTSRAIGPLRPSRSVAPPVLPPPRMAN